MPSHVLFLEWMRGLELLKLWIQNTMSPPTLMPQMQNLTKGFRISLLSCTLGWNRTLTDLTEKLAHTVRPFTSFHDGCTVLNVPQLRASLPLLIFLLYFYVSQILILFHHKNLVSKYEKWNIWPRYELIAEIPQLSFLLFSESRKHCYYGPVCLFLIHSEPALELLSLFSNQYYT